MIQTRVADKTKPNHSKYVFAAILATMILLNIANIVVFGSSDIMSPKYGEISP